LINLDRPISQVLSRWSCPMVVMVKPPGFPGLNAVPGKASQLWRLIEIFGGTLLILASLATIGFFFHLTRSNGVLNVVTGEL
jgi:hypothetical protein